MRGGMPGIGEDDIEIVEGDAPAVIAGGIVGDTLGGKIHRDLEIGDKRGAGRLADIKRITRMIVMVMKPKIHSGKSGAPAWTT